MSKEQQLENFGIWIPKYISENKELTSTAKLVFGFLDGFTRNGKDCYASSITIATWCGCGERSIVEAVQSLKEAGLIDIYYAKDNTRHMASAKSAEAFRGNCGTPSAETADNNIGDNNNYNLSPAATAIVEKKELVNKDKKPSKRELAKAEADAKTQALASESPYFMAAFASSMACEEITDSWRAWEYACKFAHENKLRDAFIAVNKGREPQYHTRMSKWVASKPWLKTPKAAEYQQSTSERLADIINYEVPGLLSGSDYAWYQENKQTVMNHLSANPHLTAEDICVLVRNRKDK